MSVGIYKGETVLLQAVPTDPFTGAVLTTLTATVGFYLPTKSPKTVVADRVFDIAPVPMTFDTARQAYTVLVDTGGAGWTVAGGWSYRVDFTGVFTAWEYGTLNLKV